MSQDKIFNDPIHGTIKLEPLLVKIIDTPEFQRLRHIKQLGGAYYVYPGAQHNRFEHSIGTAHLAGKLVEHLRRGQPDLKIDDQDVLCVKVAGLCHDLGHGPFSHLFDNSFLPKRIEYWWKHEKGSCDMFDRMIRRIDAKSPEMLSEQDRLFIKEMINGDGMEGEWTYKGRSEDKSFLYEIISNKTNGVDVDKWDYFARDCHHLGFARGFDHDRFIECTKVFDAQIGEQSQRRRICYRDKEVYNLYEMFHTRFNLHKRAYKHKAVIATEMMICDALCEADPIIKISQCVENLDSFCHLDDRILLVIERSHDPKLQSAKRILTRLSNGDKYQCVASKMFKTPTVQHQTVETELRISYEKQIQKFLENKLPAFQNQIRVAIITFNYGKKEKDPIKFCMFYTKENKTQTMKREDVSSLLPSVFQEHWVQVFLTAEEYTKDDIKSLSDAFDLWLVSCQN